MTLQLSSGVPPPEKRAGNTQAIRPLRILHVVFSLDLGGMENGVVNVASLLNPAEFEVFVCCLERRGAFAERLANPENVFVLGKKPGFSFRATVQLIGLLRRLKIDIVHSHNLGPLIYAGLATGWGRWKPLLQGEHGQLAGENLTPRLLRLRRLFYTACASVHTVSHGLRQGLIDHGFSAQKIVAIVNGVDTQRFTPEDREKVRRQLSLPSAGPVVGIVGRLCLNKRFIELMDAFALLQRQRPEARLLIVGGDGPDRNAIYEHARRSQASTGIILAGFQRNPAPYYQAMDLLVAPSLFEGLSNAVLEAMACGIPALVHQACGNSEIISNGVDGFIFQIETVAQLHEKLLAVLTDVERLKQAGLRAREKAVQQFSLQSMAAGYAHVYRELATANDLR